MMEDFLWPIIMVLIAALVVFIGAITIWRTRRERKAGFPRSDERTSRITGKAAFYSLYIGLFFMLAILLTLMVGTEFFDFPDLDAMPALNSSILVFSVSFLVLQWYFNRKGDS
jgi:protein-S-isoprenylcysteine O-methyltransferase Ste14